MSDDWREDYSETLSQLSLKEWKIRDFPILEASVQSIMYVERDRNAYAGNRSLNYFDGLFAFSRRSLEMESESKRSRGSGLQIREVPALCLSGPRHALVGAQLSSLVEKPLSRIFRGPLFAKKIVRSQSNGGMVWLGFADRVPSNSYSSPWLRRWHATFPPKGKIVWTPETKPRLSKSEFALMAATAERINSLANETNWLWQLIRKARPDLNEAPSDMSLSIEGTGESRRLVVAYENERAEFEMDMVTSEGLKSIVASYDFEWRVEDDDQ